MAAVQSTGSACSWRCVVRSGAKGEQSEKERAKEGEEARSTEKERKKERDSLPHLYCVAYAEMRQSGGSVGQPAQSVFGWAEHHESKRTTQKGRRRYLSLSLQSKRSFLWLCTVQLGGRARHTRGRASALAKGSRAIRRRTVQEATQTKECWKFHPSSRALSLSPSFSPPLPLLYCTHALLCLSRRGRRSVIVMKTTRPEKKGRFVGVSSFPPSPPLCRLL